MKYLIDLLFSFGDFCENHQVLATLFFVCVMNLHYQVVGFIKFARNKKIQGDDCK